MGTITTLPTAAPPRDIDAIDTRFTECCEDIKQRLGVRFVGFFETADGSVSYAWTSDMTDAHALGVAIRGLKYLTENTEE